MKKILLLSFMTIILSSYAFSQGWKIVSSPFMKSSIQDIFFVSENEGWAAVDSGYFYHTTNGGVSWETQNFDPAKPKAYSLKKLFFLNSSLGWAGAAQGQILITTDGGKSWAEKSLTAAVPNIVFSYFDAITFTSAKEGFVIAGKDKAVYLLKTTDGGFTWTKKDSLVTTTSQRWYDISFFDANTGAAAGDKKDIFRYTSDKGEKWTASSVTDALFGMQKSIKWLNATTVLSMGEGNEFNGVPTPVYKSSDAGKTWTKMKFSEMSYDRIKDSYFKNANEGIAVGSNGFAKMFYAKTSDGGENWKPYMGQFSMGLQAVTGVNNTIYAIGPESHIVKSTDFGTNWSILPNKTPTAIYGLQFKGTKGFALSRSSDILVSEDGTGESWNYSSSAGAWDGYSMSFTSSTTGFVLKENRHILKTTDAGKTWRTVLEPVAFNSRNKVGGITFPDASTGYAWQSLDAYDDYRIWKTTDAGETWTQKAVVPGPGYISGDAGFFDANTGILAGPGRWMRRTTDGGSTWDTVSIAGIPAAVTKADFEDIAIIDNSHGFVIGSKQILYTADKGKTWTYVDHGVKNIDSSFYTITFQNDKTGYIGCFDGTILKTADGGKTWSADNTFTGKYYIYSSGVNESGRAFFGTANGYIIASGQGTAVESSTSAVPSGYSLGQNYPNPFNPSTSIGFYLPSAGKVMLKVYDILGNESASLVNEYMNAGYHTATFDAGHLSSGTYFYQLSVQGTVITKKMSLIK